MVNATTEKQSPSMRSFPASCAHLYAQMLVRVPAHAHSVCVCVEWSQAGVQMHVHMLGLSADPCSATVLPLT